MALSRPPASNPPPVGLDDRELRTLASQIARDLLQSPTYRDILDILAATPADRNPEAAQLAIQTIARHAVRTTLKYFRSRPAAMPTFRSHPPLPLPPRPKVERSFARRRQAAGLASLPACQTGHGARHRVRRTTTPTAVSPDRQTAYLRTLGSRLRARRQSCRFSLAQLHHLTKIPLQHLQAFESGQLDALPTNPSSRTATTRSTASSQRRRSKRPGTSRSSTYATLPNFT